MQWNIKTQQSKAQNKIIMQSKKKWKAEHWKFWYAAPHNKLRILTCYACIGFTIPKWNTIFKFIEIRSTQTQVAHTCS